MIAVLSQNFPGKPRNTPKPSVRAAGVPAGIGTENLPNTDLELYLHIKLFCSFCYFPLTYISIVTYYLKQLSTTYGEVHCHVFVPIDGVQVGNWLYF
jgi:hypothetical protein